MYKFNVTLVSTTSRLIRIEPVYAKSSIDALCNMSYAGALAIRAVMIPAVLSR